jgi:hypothetical protein
MKKSFIFFNFIFMLAYSRYLITSDPQNNQSALAQLSDTLLESNLQETHAIKTGLLLFSCEEMLTKFKETERLIETIQQRLQATEQAENTEPANASNSLGGSKDSNNAELHFKNKVAMAAMITPLTLAVPAFATITSIVLKKNNSNGRGDLTSLGIETATGSWIPSAIKIGLGVGCGVITVAGSIFAGVALKNKFLEMHQKYQVGQRASNLNNKQLQQDINLLQAAVLQQRTFFKPIIVALQDFQTAAAEDIHALAAGQRRVIELIDGKNGLLKQLVTCRETLDKITANVESVTLKVAQLEEVKKTEEAPVAPSAQKLKLETPKLKLGTPKKKK